MEVVLEKARLDKMTEVLNSQGWQSRGGMQAEYPAICDMLTLLSLGACRSAPRVAKPLAPATPATVRVEVLY